MKSCPTSTSTALFLGLVGCGGIPAWRGSLLLTTLRGKALHRLTISTNGSTVTAAETLFVGEFGRLRDVLVAPDGAVYIATSNKDGRGSPLAGDDRILRIVPR